MDNGWLNRTKLSLSVNVAEAASVAACAGYVTPLESEHIVKEIANNLFDPSSAC